MIISGAGTKFDFEAAEKIACTPSKKSKTGAPFGISGLETFRIAGLSVQSTQFWCPSRESDQRRQP
ncbi:MAG TPA: hypothetical protein PKC18_18360 [Lacipirellulaceae bacterium]|nr:hypothetical protein [Lacipirellulaceae bacterium]